MLVRFAGPRRSAHRAALAFLAAAWVLVAAPSYASAADVPQAPPSCTATQALAVVQSTPARYAFACTDPNGDPITYTLGTRAMGPTTAFAQSVTIEGGELVYVPGERQSGGDVLFVTASDGQGSTLFTLNVTVSVAPRPDCPNLGPDVLDFDKDALLTDSVADRCTPQPGTSLTYRLKGATRFGGKVTLAPNGTFTYLGRPGPLRSDFDAFEVIANDGHYDSYAFTVSFRLFLKGSTVPFSTKPFTVAPQRVLSMDFATFLTCPSACAINGSLTVDRATAVLLGLSPKAGVTKVTIGTGHSRAKPYPEWSPSGWVYVFCPVSRSIESHLTRLHQPIHVTETYVMTMAGKRTVRSRVVTIKP